MGTDSRYCAIFPLLSNLIINHKYQKKVVLLARGDLQAYRWLFFVFSHTKIYIRGWELLDKMEEILWKKYKGEKENSKTEMMISTA